MIMSKGDVEETFDHQWWLWIRTRKMMMNMTNLGCDNDLYANKGKGDYDGGGGDDE